jgi:Zn finger protein HypA/HybF involved in hydrogenase expression
MHEMSIAHEVCRITEEHVGADQLGQVVEVGLEVGDQAATLRSRPAGDHAPGRQ